MGLLLPKKINHAEACVHRIGATAIRSDSSDPFDPFFVFLIRSDSPPFAFDPSSG